MVSTLGSGSDISDNPKDKDQEKGDEVLRRLLKTPPDHRRTGENGKGRTPKQNKSAERERNGDD
jgi:hypothetical protein